MFMHCICFFLLFRRDNYRNDNALFYFNIDCDLRPLWNWNVKQLYVSVYAEYEAKKVVFFNIFIRLEQM